MGPRSHDPLGRLRLTMQFIVAAMMLLALMAVGAGPVSAHGVEAHVAAASKPTEQLDGVVEDLVVDDRVNGRIYHFPQLRLPDGSTVALTGEALGTLQSGDRAGLSGVRNGTALEVTTLDWRDASPGLAPPAQPAPVEGMFTIAHADDFVNGTSEFRYDVQGDDGSVTPLRLATLPAVLQGGMRVQVQGRPVDGGAALVPLQIVVLAASPADDLPPQDKLGTKATAVHKVLVILANFSNTVAPSLTAAQALAVMTSNSSNVAGLYNESSFGAHQLNVTVTPNWVTMNYAKPAGCISSNLSAFSAAANAAAAAAGYVSTNYEFIVYVFPPGGCGWSGLAYIGFPKQAYINGPGSFTTSVVGHEMGHNFGLLHAGSLRCTGGAVMCSTGTVAEYGDPFSTMGNAHAGHFNAMQKSYLGWITAPTVKTHASGTATYTLNPIETGGGSTYAVKVPTANAKRTYWLEYRQPIGYDGMWTGWASNGVQIRVANPFETYCGGCDSWSDDTELLDATPATSTFNDAALLVGGTYTDPNYPVTINVISGTPTALTVQVITGGGGGAGATVTSLASSAHPLAVGARVTFTATVTGVAPTGSVRFVDGATTISGCAAVALGGAGNSRTAACTTSSLALGAHGITAA
jgi:hypothetical protein